MLTHKQKNMLATLIEHFEHNDVPPSYQELCEKLNLKSKSGIHRLIIGLEERGYIRRLPNRARALEVVRNPDGSRVSNFGKLKESGGTAPASDSESTIGVPLVGKIAAGRPIEAISDHSDTLQMPSSMLGKGEYFALKIEGDSMTGEGIMDGDTVLVERCSTAPNNSIVVALIDGEEATLKKMRRKGDSVALEAANPAFETRIFGPDRVEVQGKLAGLVRTY